MTVASQSRSPGLSPGGQSSSAAVATSSAAAVAEGLQGRGQLALDAGQRAAVGQVGADPMRGLRGGHPLDPPASPILGNAARFCEQGRGHGLPVPHGQRSNLPGQPGRGPICHPLQLPRP